MSTDLGLPFEPTLQQRFDKFDAENPQVFRALVALGRKWKAAGHHRCGIAMLFEVLRYEHGLQTSGDEFKLNNDFRSRYARKMIETYPNEFARFFETRELQVA